MVHTHHAALLFAYAVAVGAWALLLAPAGRRLWPGPTTPPYARPWREFGWSLVAAAAVILLGQLYSAGIRLRSGGLTGHVLEAINHLVIFAPMPLLLLLRRQPLASAWLPLERVGSRLIIGLGLALIATTVFTLVRHGADPFWRVIPRLLLPEQLRHATQVFMEDFTIGVILQRLTAALRRPAPATWGVAALFAAGHIPALLQEGASAPELALLIGDFMLAGMVLTVVRRSRDIWWFFPVHYAMDMMQFARVSGVPSG